MPLPIQPPAPPPAQSVAAPQADPALELLGKRAPAFALPDQNDRTVKLSDTKGKWVVLAFYPADMTRGCTLQNRAYTAAKEQIAALGAVVYTLSTQDTASKRAFCEKEALSHTLLSDVGGKVAAAYRVLMADRGVARRVTFYVDPRGRVAAVDTRINPQTAAEDTLATLKRLGAGPKEKP